MKKLVLLAVCALSTQFAMAQTKVKKSSLRAPAATSANTTTTTRASVQSNEWYNNHVSVGAFFSNASELKGANASLVGSNEKGIGADFATSSGLGLNAAYTDDIDAQFAWFAGLQLYTQKSLDSLKLQGTNLKLTNSPSFQPLVVYGGAAFKVNDSVYIPFALNATLLNAQQKGDFESFSMTPKIGLQLGVGAKLEKQFALEMNYQAINYELDSKFNKNVQIKGDLKLEGVNLSGRYIF